MSTAQFLPLMASDETIYSWCATAWLMSADVSAEAWALSMLGVSHAPRQQDFPSYLPALLSRHLPQLTYEAALRFHTVAGMFWPFIDRSRRACMILAHATSGGSASALTARRALLSHSRTMTVRMPLKQCSSCVREDLETVGRPYWHVQHQWPTAFVCLRHGRALDIVAHPPKRWILPAVQERSSERNGILSGSIDNTSVMVAAVSNAMSSMDYVDTESLRGTTIRRLQSLGVLHSTWSVRHTRVEAWFAKQPASAWCRQHLAEMADGSWLARLLWRTRQDHPIRWIVAWSSLAWDGVDEAVRALRDAQMNVEAAWDDQLALFGPDALSIPPRSSATMPDYVRVALRRESTYAAVQRRTGVSRSDITRWLASDPVERVAWRERLRSERVESAETVIRRHLQACGSPQRSDVEKRLAKEVRLLRTHAPSRLEALLRALPARAPRQPSLF